MKIKRRIRSFEADVDVDEMINAAQESGLTVTEITNAALKKFGAETISKIKAEKIARLGKYPAHREGNYFGLNDEKSKESVNSGKEHSERMAATTVPVLGILPRELAQQVPPPPRNTPHPEDSSAHPRKSQKPGPAKKR